MEIGNIIFAEYVNSLPSDEGILRDCCRPGHNGINIIDSHLFNLERAELVIDRLNGYLSEEISLERLLAFLNCEARLFESEPLTIKEKKQRYVIIIVNALASTLWRHPFRQRHFIDHCREQIGIDQNTWDTRTSRICRASDQARKSPASRSNTVSYRALDLREALYDELNIPYEHRL